MKLKKTQKEAMLEWIAEGVTSDIINERATLFDPPFSVSRQQVDHYRKTRKLDIVQIVKGGEIDALSTGLATKANRVILLKDIAEELRKDLFDKKLLWTDQVKGIGSREDFKVIEYEEFNGAEVSQLRGVLDDIAKEVGDRKAITEVTGKDGGPIEIGDARQAIQRKLGIVTSSDGTE